MFKKSIVYLLCVCLFISCCSYRVFAEESPNFKEPSTHSVGEISGYLYGNTKAVKQLYEIRKFNIPVSGHGFAAERGNNFADYLKGLNATVVGDNNIKYGPDRMIVNRGGTVTMIQDKYYSTARNTINAAFDGADGEFLYVYNNAPMKIEVPADQYDEAVKIMKEKISAEQLANCNITDPAEAVNIVKKGALTYKQAVNLSKAGNITSLTFDAKNGTITASGALGISFAIDFVCCTLNGVEFEDAVRSAGMNGLKTGSVVLGTYVISSQLARTGLSNALVPTTEAIAKSFGKETCEAIAARSGVNAVGSSAITATSKIIAKELIVDGVAIVLITSMDVVDLFRGRISKDELLKNLSVTLVGAAGSVAGGYGGAALGSAIAPGIGTAIGGAGGAVVGGVVSSFAAEVIIAPFYESDAEEMYKLISDEFLVLAEEYLINETEGAAITDRLKSKLAGDTLKDMYSSKDRNKFARDLMEPLFTEQVKKRNVIEMPLEDELRYEMKTALQGIIFIH